MRGSSISLGFWCDFEADTDPDLMTLNNKFVQLIAASNITDEMKIHDAPTSPKRPS